MGIAVIEPQTCFQVGPQQMAVEVNPRHKAVVCRIGYVCKAQPGLRIDMWSRMRRRQFIAGLGSALRGGMSFVFRPSHASKKVAVSRGHYDLWRHKGSRAQDARSVSGNVDLADCIPW